MTQLNHDLFGEIFFESYWSGTIKTNFFGKELLLILSIDGNEEGIFQDAQTDAFTNLVSNMDNIMKDVEQGIFNYYQEVFMDYRNMLGKELADKLAPFIHNKEEIHKLVVPTQFVIRRVRNNGIRRIGLLCNCSWEVDHGIGVRIENEEVVEVGFQDIVL